MKWVSHAALGAAVCAVFNPLAVPAAVLGSTAPDWLETVESAITRRHVKHRGHTHYLALWVLAMLFFWLVWDWRGVFFWFAAGGALHWIGDALTPSGVPVGWWSDRRVHLFGGRMRGGSGAEFAIVGAVVVMCAVVIWSRHGSGGFVPFFYQWGVYYGSGFVDGLEWRTHRFDFI